MNAPVLIFAIGNESRGDDALAPLLLRKIEQWLRAGDMNGDKFELIEAFQLQIENTLDMQGRELILFIDAGMATPVPFYFSRAGVTATPNLFSHALTPASLLALYHQIHGESAPPAFILCLRGEQFELGAALSADAESRMDQALRFMQELLHQADAATWDAFAENENCVMRRAQHPKGARTSAR